MKTLILSGSPHRSGDTASLIAEWKRHAQGEVAELWAYYDDIAPCTDCRWCWKAKRCAIRDGMDAVYADDFDVVVIASPIYMSTLTGPLVGLASRFQCYYAARRFLKSPFPIRKKAGALLLVGGGDGSANDAVRLSECMFRYLNAECGAQNTALSLNTDRIPASEDCSARGKIAEIARRVYGEAVR